MSVIFILATAYFFGTNLVKGYNYDLLLNRANLVVNSANLFTNDTRVFRSSYNKYLIFLNTYYCGSGTFSLKRNLISTSIGSSLQANTQVLDNYNNIFLKSMSFGINNKKSELLPAYAKVCENSLQFAN